MERPPEAPAAAGAMSRGRRRLVHLLLAVVAAGSAYDILVFREHWPFSHNPMYATVQGPTFERFRLFGVTAEGEVPLAADEHFAPFDDPRLSTMLLRIAAHPRAREALPIASDALLERYRTLAAQGAHDGPPLRGLRLYRLVWRLDPTLANLDRPERRQLLLAMEPPAAGDAAVAGADGAAAP